MQEMPLLPMQEGLFHLMQERLLLLIQERLTFCSLARKGSLSYVLAGEGSLSVFLMQKGLTQEKLHILS